jgi:predicted regulator of Ras-like GTPase activity (Roadblock/LC7/MglB family)
MRDRGFPVRVLACIVRFLKDFPEVCLIQKILEELVATTSGAQAVIFLDGDGESIAHAGDMTMDIKLLGAWKEIQLDHIKDIAGRLGLGNVRAVLFSLDEGNELIAPVFEDYCLLLFFSAYANLQDAMAGLKKAIELLKKEIE